MPTSWSGATMAPATIRTAPAGASNASARSRLAPSFDLTEDGSYLIDLDGDRIADLLTFRNGRAMAFLNRGGAGWEGPAVLGDGGLPRFVGLDRRLRMADMNGDGMSDLVLLRARRIDVLAVPGQRPLG